MVCKLPLKTIPEIPKYSGSLDIRVHFSTIKLLKLIMVMSSYGKVEQEEIQFCPQRKRKKPLRSVRIHLWH